jgi:hypothetical protein
MLNAPRPVVAYDLLGSSLRAIEQRQLAEELTILVQPLQRLLRQGSDA